MRSTPAPSASRGPGECGCCVAATAEEVELAQLDRYDDDADAPPWVLDPVTDADLLARLGGEPQAIDLALLVSIDPRALPHPLDVVAYAQALDKVAALVAAQQHRVALAMAGASASAAYLDEVHVEHEMAVARRMSRHEAHQRVGVARHLASSFPSFVDALAAGQISEAHCRRLAERTRDVTHPAALSRIEALALPKARRLPAGRFGSEVAALVTRLDPDAAGRARRARTHRGVTTRRLDDGLGHLGLTHDWSTICAIADTLDTDARALRASARSVYGTTPPTQRRSESDDGTLDALRADALAARILGTVDDDGSVTWCRSEANVVVNVVMDLDTLRIERDRLDTSPDLALLDGEPVPASLARELADSATWWRRLVTDPVEGHLLDYGTATYLPSRLRRHVLARDGKCRAPGCTNRAPSRLQMDHAVEFPDGASSTANCGALCTTCHQLKTAGYVDITDSHADGSATWLTAWGQRVHLPPRRVLPGTEPEREPLVATPSPPPPDAPSLDPPPF